MVALTRGPWVDPGETVTDVAQDATDAAGHVLRAGNTKFYSSGTTFYDASFPGFYAYPGWVKTGTSSYQMISTVLTATQAGLQAGGPRWDELPPDAVGFEVMVDGETSPPWINGGDTPPCGMTSEDVAAAQAVYLEWRRTHLLPILSAELHVTADWGAYDVEVFPDPALTVGRPSDVIVSADYYVEPYRSVHMTAADGTVTGSAVAPSPGWGTQSYTLPPSGAMTVPGFGPVMPIAARSVYRPGLPLTGLKGWTAQIALSGAYHLVTSARELFRALTCGTGGTVPLRQTGRTDGLLGAPRQVGGQQSLRQVQVVR